MACLAVIALVSIGVIPSGLGNASGWVFIAVAVPAVVALVLRHRMFNVGYWCLSVMLVAVVGAWLIGSQAPSGFMLVQ